ncbi:MAG: LruC domain-containing protein [Prevotella sp.]|nr:LruC domain-containing protein [Prevotella sp.]
MKRNHTIFLLLAAALGLSLESCNKEMFNQQLYNEIITQQFPIDPIDDTHNWELSTRRSIVIKANANMENMEKVMVLSKNPLTSSDAQIMAEAEATTEGGLHTLLFAAPSSQTSFYAAVKTTDKQYAVVPFTTSNSQVSFEDKTTGTLTSDLDYYSFTYCFEENFPEPGDYDFNDCVMRMSVMPGTKKNQVKLIVTLAAAGAKRQIAAAVRLKGCNADDIESVEIEEGKAFDDGYPLTLRSIPDGSTFQRGRDEKQPVIRLFEDAMWCLIREQASDNGVLNRYYVNVSRAESETFKKADPVKRTYIINFKESSSAASMLQNILTDNLDPFIVTPYNNNYWETHTYQDRLAQVLYEYHDQTSIHITWALGVPSGTFRWPLEAKLIGSYKDGVLTGAYRKDGHSFGEWAAKKENSRDWFLYPTTSEVY